MQKKRILFKLVYHILPGFALLILDNVPTIFRNVFIIGEIEEDEEEGKKICLLYQNIRSCSASRKTFFFISTSFRDLI